MTASPRLRCEGAAANALHVYQKRMNELKKEGRPKPDMIAFKELRNNYTPNRKHGELPGVPIGLELEGRGEAAILGIHRSILSGIDSIKGEACYAVCLSGGYENDEEDSADGTIYYTGSGGKNSKTGRHVEDQKLNADNESLSISCHRGTPIRMLIGKSPCYQYVGLYKCVEYKTEPSVDGPLVYKFTLEPIEGKWIRSSCTVDSVMHHARSRHVVKSANSNNVRNLHQIGRSRANVEGRRTSEFKPRTNEMIDLRKVKEIKYYLEDLLPKKGGKLKHAGEIAKESEARCKTMFERLDTLNVTLQIMKDTEIGKVIAKFRRHEKFGQDATALIEKWKRMLKENPVKIKEEMVKPAYDEVIEPCKKKIKVEQLQEPAPSLDTQTNNEVPRTFSKKIKEEPEH